jgi:endonuclease-3
LKPSAITVKAAHNLLKRHYPDAHCALNYDSPFQLLIATILSAQCTDVKVNEVTAVLFSKYPKAEDLAKAPLGQLEKMVHSTGFFKNKAKNIKNCALALVQDHGGEVPPDPEILVGLAGVGRKTANVVLGNAFNIASGVVVDTHVGRISTLLGWTSHHDPVKIEADLRDLFPKSDWIMLSHLLISHGRSLCVARKPRCQDCFLADLCPGKL